MVPISIFGLVSKVENPKTDVGSRGGNAAGAFLREQFIVQRLAAGHCARGTIFEAQTK
jgi:hypothetical protein